MPEFINGEKVILRGLRPEDINETYRAWLDDPEVNRFLETRFRPQSLERIAEFVRAMDEHPDQILLAMCLAADGRHVGNIKLGPVNRVHRFADISLFIGDKTAWGKGVASEAIGLLADYAFNTLDLVKVQAGVYEGNTGSARAFEKAGFFQEARLLRQFVSEGRRVDKLCMCRFRDGWRPQ